MFVENLFSPFQPCRSGFVQALEAADVVLQTGLNMFILEGFCWDLQGRNVVFSDLQGWIGFQKLDFIDSMNL